MSVKNVCVSWNTLTVILLNKRSYPKSSGDSTS